MSKELKENYITNCTDTGETITIELTRKQFLVIYGLFSDPNFVGLKEGYFLDSEKYISDRDSLIERIRIQTKQTGPKNPY